MHMNTQDKQTMKEFEGYVSVDTKGAVWFMDAYPVLQRTHREIMQPNGSVKVTDDCYWYNSNGHYDMFLGFEKDVKSGISENKPVPALLQVLI